MEWQRPRSTSAGQGCARERTKCDRSARGQREGERTHSQVSVGVDSAAETCTAAWRVPGGPPTMPFTREQTPAGFAALRHRLQGTGGPPAATLVVLEATGNSWVALAVALHEAGERVAVVTPRQAHHCAKAQLRRAKTAALDARDLAQLAAALRPAPWTPPPAVDHAVRQRLVARDGLLAMRTQARNQRHALLQWPVVVAAVRQHLDALIAGCPLGASTGGSPRWRPRARPCARGVCGRSHCWA